ncbi:hypothetical protein GQ43DRAFT_88388 [Delitschia confertaspora ATCC 74209]|uniref:Uncharacterized protein n=1 Tax=Delitschia confertaspora ATCC 74209 TaxID=1513339 RepID=A0A9P4MRN9_9PLEO|nr:hypothetical protein GQ43DRAFT_88388 [Delitschia confertaspora ATCC 74209]
MGIDQTLPWNPSSIAVRLEGHMRFGSLFIYLIPIIVEKTRGQYNAQSYTQYIHFRTISPLPHFRRKIAMIIRSYWQPIHPIRLNLFNLSTFACSKPLSTAYSRELSNFMYNCQGMSSIRNRNSFQLFY